MAALLIIALAGYYIAFAVTQTHGIGGVFEALRARYPLGGLTTCIYCMLPYTGLLCLIVWAVAPPLVIWLGIAGAGVIFHRLGDDF